MCVNIIYIVMPSVEVGAQAAQEVRGEVVMVTGGSGFLGQHIVKLLQIHSSSEKIREIRVFDIQPYSNNLSE